jgi:hypothetical protein
MSKALDVKPVMQQTVTIRNAMDMPHGKSPGDVQKELAAFTPEKDRMVKGQFKNIERPGDGQFIDVKFYKGQKPFRHDFKDGEVLEIPLSVAIHLNHACCYPVGAHLQDINGNKFQGVGKWVYRYEFKPTEFL